MKNFTDISLRFALVCLIIIITAGLTVRCQSELIKTAKLKNNQKQAGGARAQDSFKEFRPDPLSDGKSAPPPFSSQKVRPEALKKINAAVKASKKDKNFWFFKTKIYPVLRRAECGACNDLCHFDPKDRGGVTCAGMAINHNPDFFAWELNHFVKDCLPSAGGGGLFCKRRLFESDLKRRFYIKYARRFAVCAPAAFALIVDSAVLSGPATATKLLQGAGGLKQDGLFGPKTAALCARRRGFPAGKFTAARIARFRGLKQCGRYCSGWIKRARRALKQYKAAADGGGGIKIPAPIFGGY